MGSGAGWVESLLIPEDDAIEKLADCSLTISADQTIGVMPSIESGNIYIDDQTCDKCGQSNLPYHVCWGDSGVRIGNTYLADAYPSSGTIFIDSQRFTPEIVLPSSTEIITVAVEVWDFVELIGSHAVEALAGFLERCSNPGSDGMTQASASLRKLFLAALEMTAANEMVFRSEYADPDTKIRMTECGEVEHRSRLKFVDKIFRDQDQQGKNIFDVEDALELIRFTNVSLHKHVLDSRNDDLAKLQTDAIKLITFLGRVFRLREQN